MKIKIFIAGSIILVIGTVLFLGRRQYDLLYGAQGSTVGGLIAVIGFIILIYGAIAISKKKIQN